MIKSENRYLNYLLSTIFIVLPLSSGAGYVYALLCGLPPISLFLFTSITGLLIAVLSVTKNYYKFMLPIIKTDQIIRDMTNGDLSKRLPVKGTGEYDMMASSFNSFVTSIQNSIRLMSINGSSLQQQTDLLKASSCTVRKHLEQTSQKTKEADNISNNLMSILKNAGNCVKSTTEKTESLKTETNKIVSIMNQTSIKTNKSRENISTIATASEQMTITVEEIARNSEQARQNTGYAVNSVSSAQTSVDKLGLAASEIENIIDVIVEIAEQTKLLALNATIEAARAGEAGKGFSVVAGEVKELAKQTSDATDDIRKKISIMQSSTESTINEITHISGVIHDVDEMVESIASSVEEQSIATKNIANNIRRVDNLMTELSDSTVDSSKEIHMLCNFMEKSCKSMSDVVSQMNSANIESEKISGAIVDIVKLIDDSCILNTEMNGIYHKIQQISKDQKQVAQKFKI